MSLLDAAHHMSLTDWAKAAVAPLPGICATAAAIADLAEAAWTAEVAKREATLELTLTGRLCSAYSGRAARLAIGRYARTWGDGHVDVRVVDGRVIASALVAVGGYAPAQVSADLGPADASDTALVLNHYQGLTAEARIPDLIGPGVS